MKKNLKNIQKKYKNLKFLLKALKIQDTEKHFKRKAEKLLSKLDPKKEVVDFSVFNQQKKAFQDIHNEIDQFNFDYLTQIDKSCNLSLKHSYYQQKE